MAALPGPVQTLCLVTAAKSTLGYTSANIGNPWIYGNPPYASSLRRVAARFETSLRTCRLPRR